MLYNIKMHANDPAGRHISGAERLVDDTHIDSTLRSLTHRAFHHSNGIPSDIHLSIHAVNDTTIRYLDALPRRVLATTSVASARAAVIELLTSHNIAHAEQLWDHLCSIRGMRGAALLDADTLTRRDHLGQRGVRVTALDNDLPPDTLPHAGTKPYYYEALTLATKVAAHPAILAELCISDDPDYTTGYVALAGEYIRIDHMKEAGLPAGGRIFVVRGSDELIADCINYLHNQPVIVTGIPPATPPTPPDGAASIDTFARNELAAWDAAGLTRTPPLIGAHGPTWSDINGTRMLNFASSDYLGLSHHPDIAAAHSQASHYFGTSSTGSRLTTGNTRFHVAAEQAAAQLTGYEQAVLFSTGYQANVATLHTLSLGLPKGADPALTIFSDADNHASLIDGIRLAAKNPAVQVIVYAHCDMEDLEKKLAQCTSPRRLIVSDGVFSMAGDICPLPDLVQLARRYGAWTMIDDAHGVGTVGATGRGTVEHFAPALGDARPDILTVTASKALGGEGALICTSTPVAQLLRNRARGYVYSTAISPQAAAGIEAALTLLIRQEAPTAALAHTVRHLRHTLHTAGFSVDAAGCTPIVPVPIGDEKLAADVSAALAREGLWAPAIRYPTVARGHAIIRLTVTAAHSHAEINRCVHTLRAVVDQPS